MFQNNFYPEIHRILSPHIEEAATRYDGSSFDNQKLDSMVDSVVNRSGIMRNPPRGHSRNSINDFTRFWLLCRIFGQCPPIFFPPVFPPVRPFANMPMHGQQPMRPFVNMPLQGQQPVRHFANASAQEPQTQTEQHSSQTLEANTNEVLSVSAPYFPPSPDAVG